MKVRFAIRLPARIRPVRSSAVQISVHRFVVYPVAFVVIQFPSIFFFEFTNRAQYERVANLK